MDAIAQVTMCMAEEFFFYLFANFAGQLCE
jgi:hypothetical protein